MNETTDGTGAGMIFFENDFVSLPSFCVIKVIIYGKGESSMLYIWSYLKKYPKWLALNLFSAVLFVIVNLGLPTILARMIDEGINPRVMWIGCISGAGSCLRSFCSGLWDGLSCLTRLAS